MAATYAKRAWRLVCATLVVAVLASCVRTPTATTTPTTLTTSGSTAMNPLLTSLADRFQQQYPSIIVTVEESNSAQGMERALDGKAALGMLSAPPPDSLWAAPIAVGGIAVIVHPDNPLQNLTLSQLHDILDGRLWHWSELGLKVPEDEIGVVSREEGSGTRLMFESVVMTSSRPPAIECQPFLPVHPDSQSRDSTPSRTPSCEGDPVTSMAIIMISSAAVVEFVAQHPGAIGYVSSGYLSNRGALSPAVKAVRVENIPPEPRYIADGSYRLGQPFFLAAPREPSGVARLFVDFCLSPDGQALLGQQYVPAHPRE